MRARGREAGQAPPGNLGPQRPGPDEAAAEVAFTRVPALAENQIERLARWLTAEERIRAERFVFPKDRRLFVAAHALLHSCLETATGIRRPRISAGAYGKPVLDPPCGSPPLYFNLSHTQGLAACVVTRGYAAGIDAEEMAPRKGLEEIARWAFTEEEQQLIESAAGDLRLRVFYRLWTLKEAVAKGIGRGLGVELQDIAFKLEPLTLTIAGSMAEEAGGWQVREFAPTAEHRLALAVRIPAAAALNVTLRPVAIGHLIERAAVL